MEKETKHLYFGAFKTCLEMMIDRKYQVPSRLQSITEREFTLTSSYLELQGIVDPKSGFPVTVLMSTHLTKSEILDDIKRLITPESKVFDVTKIRNVKVIVIYNAEIVKLDDQIGYPFIEFFDVHLMFVNPTKHIYQPKWRLMTEDEITQMLKRYTVKTAQPSRLQLGSICFDDPINRYYDGHPPSKDYKGDVYEIIRDGISVFYRKVTAKRMNL